MTIIKPPYDLGLCDGNLKTVFLAGSIEQGRAIEWQKYCTEKLSEYFNILNPRRDNWDPTLTQDMADATFNQQVNWELDGLELSDYILMYLESGTKSPISLMELGLMIRTGKMIIVCPKGFWRKGNVDILCHRYSAPQYETLDEALAELIQKK